METTYWHRQAEKPIYGELEWNKPERRDQAGKILIIGGDAHNLGAPATAFETLKSTGVGAVKIALPDKTKRLVGKTLPEALFLPSTTSGEFSTDGELELFDNAVWADCLLLPGDSGRNSQTTILFSSALSAYSDLIVLTRDAVDILSSNPAQLFQRERTTLVVTFAQLQKLMKNFNEQTPLTFAMDLVKLVDFLHTFTQSNPVTIITLHQNQLIIAVNGSVCTTKLTKQEEPKKWRVRLSAIVACYQVWNPHKPFESAVQACYILSKTL